MNLTCDNPFFIVSGAATLSAALFPQLDDFEPLDIVSTSPECFNAVHSRNMFKLDGTIEPKENGRKFTLVLQKEREKDICLRLRFHLPMQGEEMRWGYDITPQGQSRAHHESGFTDTIPIVAAGAGTSGVALYIPPDKPEIQWPFTSPQAVSRRYYSQGMRAFNQDEKVKK